MLSTLELLWVAIPFNLSISWAVRCKHRGVNRPQYSDTNHKFIITHIAITPTIKFSLVRVYNISSMQCQCWMLLLYNSMTNFFLNICYHMHCIHFIELYNIIILCLFWYCIPPSPVLLYSTELARSPFMSKLKALSLIFKIRSVCCHTQTQIMSGIFDRTKLNHLW